MDCLTHLRSSAEADKADSILSSLLKLVHLKDSLPCRRRATREADDGDTVDQGRTSSKDVFPFLELPAELRNMIYALAFKRVRPLFVGEISLGGKFSHLGCRDIRFISSREDLPIGRGFPTRYIFEDRGGADPLRNSRTKLYSHELPVSLLRVSKAIIKEAAPFLYNHNDLVFLNYADFFLATIGARNCSMVKAINLLVPEIACHGAKQMQMFNFGTFMSIHRLLPRLQHLNIFIMTRPYVYTGTRHLKRSVRYMMEAGFSDMVIERGSIVLRRQGSPKSVKFRTQTWGAGDDWFNGEAYSLKALDRIQTSSQDYLLSLEEEYRVCTQMYGPVCATDRRRKGWWTKYYNEIMECYDPSEQTSRWRSIKSGVSKVLKTSKTTGARLPPV